MKKHHAAAQCDHCGSDNTDHTHTAGVLRCLACGHYFEDDSTVQPKSRRYKFDDDD